MSAGWEGEEGRGGSFELGFAQPELEGRAAGLETPCLTVLPPPSHFPFQLKLGKSDNGLQVCFILLFLAEMEDGRLRNLALMATFWRPNSDSVT